jgi:hypothetical protein
LNLLIISLLFVLAHGLTALVFTPVQSIVLPEVTVFASLIYLPHGVRILATWAYGWKAIPALIAGASLSVWLFTPSEDLNFLEPALIESILVGSASAFFAFEITRFAGYNFYFGGSKKLQWKGMIDFEKIIGVWAVYAVGDLIGLIVCMVVLMLVFRWSRVFSLLKS